MSSRRKNFSTTKNRTLGSTASNSGPSKKKFKKDELIIEEENDLEKVINSKRKAIDIYDDDNQEEFALTDEESEDPSEMSDEEENDLGSKSASSYNKLLQSLASGKKEATLKKVQKNRSKDDESDDEEIDEDEDEDENIPNDDADSEDGENNSPSNDPFTLHVEKITVEEIRASLTAEPKLSVVPSDSPSLNWGVVDCSNRPNSLLPIDANSSKRFNSCLKQKLLEKWQQNQQRKLTGVEQQVAQMIFSYRDLYYSDVPSKADNLEQIETLYSLHALNHVLKTRDRVLRNTVKVKMDDSLECRDQGYSRPKVLIVLPFKNGAFRVINKLIELSGCSDLLNKKRYAKEFGPESLDNDLSGKPEDYQATFSGNTDDCFRIGLKFTRKTIRLYSAFDQSDIIVCSPLGLRLCLTEKKGKIVGADFLSSIELLILDQAHVFNMQNPEHLQIVMEHLNELPKAPGDCDFSRVRNFYLDGLARNVRQTLIFSEYPTLELNSLFANSKLSFNYEGKVKSLKQYEGCLGSIVNQCQQLFHRINCITDLTSSADERFNYFVKKTLPLIKGSALVKDHICIFIPSYFDFVRIRNYMSGETFSFECLHEYSKNSEIARARTRFKNGQVNFLLVTERFQFFRRYRIQGIQHLVFYAPPENGHHFYPELLNFMNTSTGPDTANIANANGNTCLTLFSKFDKLPMERIVGSKRWLKFSASGPDGKKQREDFRIL